MFYHLRCCFIFLLLGAGQQVAQAQSDAELAQEYFSSGDCDKAITYYTKLLKTKFDRTVLNNYTTCKIRLKQGNTVDKFFKQQIKQDPANATWYYYQLGVINEAEGKPDLAKRNYESAIDMAGKQLNFYKLLVEAFRENQKNELALKSIERAQEFANNQSLYRLEKAGVYRDMDNVEGMINELLSHGLLYRNVDIVQNMLQDFLKEENERNILEKVLYDKIQKNPNEQFYNQLLIWHQVQSLNFYKAFVQERALDKRLKYGGKRIFELAGLALKNKDYENASLMYEYIVKEYPKDQLYPWARRMVIYTQEERVRNAFPINKSEVQKLISQYQQLLDELGISERTLEAMRNMANLYAFYLDDKPKAIKLLESAIETGRGDKGFIDKCKLDLGDIYLLTNEPWEATLLYSQVEKSQKDNHLGYEAKLRNARLHYYKGDFDISKQVLDILKRATSREIANDANALSLLIMDNTGLDSSENALKSYSQVELLLFQNKTTEALDSLNSLSASLGDHSLADEIAWLKAKTYIKLDSVDKAMDNLKFIIEKFHYDILGDDAYFELAKLYENKLNNKNEAMKVYQELLEKYPGSIYTAEARKRYRLLRGDAI